MIGPLNPLLEGLGLIDEPILFFATGTNALAATVFLIVWKFVGLYMLILLVGLVLFFEVAFPEVDMLEATGLAMLMSLAALAWPLLDSACRVLAEKLGLSPPGPAPADCISIDGRVETVDYQGQVARYFVRVGDLQVQAINMIDEHPFSEGDAGSVRVRPRDCAVLRGDA